MGPVFGLKFDLGVVKVFSIFKSLAGDTGDVEFWASVVAVDDWLVPWPEEGLPLEDLPDLLNNWENELDLVSELFLSPASPSRDALSALSALPLRFLKDLFNKVSLHNCNLAFSEAKESVFSSEVDFFFSCGRASYDRVLGMALECFGIFCVAVLSELLLDTETGSEPIWNLSPVFAEDKGLSRLKLGLVLVGFNLTEPVCNALFSLFVDLASDARKSSEEQRLSLSEEVRLKWPVSSSSGSYIARDLSNSFNFSETEAGDSVLSTTTLLGSDLALSKTLESFNFILLDFRTLVSEWGSGVLESELGLFALTCFDTFPATSDLAVISCPVFRFCFNIWDISDDLELTFSNCFLLSFTDVTGGTICISSKVLDSSGGGGITRDEYWSSNANTPRSTVWLNTGFSCSNPFWSSVPFQLWPSLSLCETAPTLSLSETILLFSESVTSSVGGGCSVNLSIIASMSESRKSGVYPTLIDFCNKGWTEWSPRILLVLWSGECLWVPILGDLGDVGSGDILGWFWSSSSSSFVGG